MTEEQIKVIELVQEIIDLNEEIKKLHLKIKELDKNIMSFKKFYTGWINHKAQLGIKE
jgi:hypothetical protein